MTRKRPSRGYQDFSARAQKRMDQQEGWGKTEGWGRKEMDATSAKLVMGYQGLNRFHATVTSPNGQLGGLLFQRRGIADWKLVAIHFPQP